MHEDQISNLILTHFSDGLRHLRSFQLAPDPTWSASTRAEIDRAWAVQEDEALRLIHSAGSHTIGAPFSGLVALGSKKITDALTARGFAPRPFSLSRPALELLLSQDALAFGRAIFCGLHEPDDQELSQRLHACLLERANALQSAEAWRPALQAWCRSPGKHGEGNFVASHLLTFARSQKTRLSEGMPELLSELIAEMTRTCPARATSLLRGAIIGDDMFSAVSLLHFGAILPQDIQDLRRTAAAPHMAKVLDLLSTNHGRLTFTNTLGPQQDFFLPAASNPIDRLLRHLPETASRSPM